MLEEIESRRMCFAHKLNSPDEITLQLRDTKENETHKTLLPGSVYYVS